jgi:hypothetical protein
LPVLIAVIPGVGPKVKRLLDCVRRISALSIFDLHSRNPKGEEEQRDSRFSQVSILARIQPATENQKCPVVSGCRLKAMGPARRKESASQPQTIALQARGGPTLEAIPGTHSAAETSMSLNLIQKVNAARFQDDSAVTGIVLAVAH